jgi:hypothetical protein
LWRTDTLEKHRKMWAPGARKAPRHDAVGRGGGRVMPALELSQFLAQ